ncbi:MAG: AAA family ATPase [Chitinivibrionales bacterium]|nr:AAA family ATPase [Chitinivibrionales bacterium]
MERLLDSSLLEWTKKPKRKPLVLRGARQTGKTYAVRRLGERFSSFVEINFEQEPRFIKLFADDLKIDAIVQNISALQRVTITPGETLLFFDEIQLCPRAVVALRYFYENLPGLHVIAAGSLLEFELEHLPIPVGRLEFIFVRPFTFLEFCCASGYTLLGEQITAAAPDAPLASPLHDQAIALLREYLYIGGMPGVIAAFLENRSFLAAEEEQRSIVQTYRADFARLAGRSGIETVENAFAVIPALVGQKTVYSQIDPDARAFQIKAALDLLTKARIISRVRNSSGAGVPLAAGASEKFYKTIFLDVGLMQRQLGVRYEDWRQATLVLNFHRGAVAEQFVGQELLNREGHFEDPALFYWHRINKGSQAEVDYLCEAAGFAVPIEVKSGAAGHLRSIHQYLKSFPKVPLGIKCSQEPFGREGEKVVSVPLYAAGNIPSLIRAKQ